MSFAARTRYLVAMGLLPHVLVGLSACDPDTTPDRNTAVAATPPLPAPPVPQVPVAPVTIPPVTIPPVAIPPITIPPVAIPPVTIPPVAISPVTILPVAVAPTQPSILRRDVGGGVWVVEEVAPLDLPAAMPRATCPSGKFCLPAPGVVSMPAPPPHIDCGAVADPPESGFSRSQFDAALTVREREHRADACCYSWYEHCPGGRALRAEGVALLAPAAPRDDWTTTAKFVTSDLDLKTRERLATHWLGQAAAEHASIAAFGRSSLQLLALGAPAELVAATHTAALDEIRHARHCYALAAHYSEEQRGPGALELPPGALSIDPATVALETLRDGCLGESLAARIVAQAGAAARDPHVAGVLATIAADEEAHAALAWQTVAWLLGRYPEPVRRATEDFLADLLRTRDATGPLHTGADDHDDQRHGVLSRREHLTVQSQAVDEIIIPCLRALLGGTVGGRAAEHRA